MLDVLLFFPCSIQLQQRSIVSSYDHTEGVLIKTSRSQTLECLVSSEHITEFETNLNYHLNEFVSVKERKETHSAVPALMFQEITRISNEKLV